MVRNTKQKRRPNSVISGGRMLGTISLKTIQPMPSPRSLAASTKSMHHDIQRRGAGQAEDAGGIEQGQDEDEVDEALAERRPAASARRSAPGSARNASTTREMPWSSQPRFSAGKTPSVPPMMKEMSVVMSAMPMVLRAPIDQARERVAADLVGAEPDIPALDELIGLADDLGLAIGRDQRREDRADGIDQDDDHAEPGAERRGFQVAPDILDDGAAGLDDADIGGVAVFILDATVVDW